MAASKNLDDWILSLDRQLSGEVNERGVRGRKEREKLREELVGEWVKRMEWWRAGRWGAWKT